jgi:REP element-mobilizing transposase RayT
MKCRFGKVENEEMIFNEFGSIANDEWLKLPERFPNFELDVFQIMPNHMHGIIVLNETPVGVGFTPTQNMQDKRKNVLNENMSALENGAGVNLARTVNPTVGDIVGAYKSLVANACLDIYKSKNKIMGKLWQRDYYEHIIRKEQSYQRISDYIINNPAKWDADKFFDR